MSRSTVPDGPINEEIGIIAALFPTKKTMAKTGLTCIKWTGGYADGTIEVEESNGSPRPTRRVIGASLLDDFETLVQAGTQGKVKIFRTPQGTLNFPTVDACLKAAEQIPW